MMDRQAVIDLAVQEFKAPQNTGDEPYSVADALDIALDAHVGSERELNHLEYLELLHEVYEKC